MLGLFITLLEILATATVQAVQETWGYMLLAIIIMIAIILSTKPWAYKNMKAWLKSLED